MIAIDCAPNNDISPAIHVGEKGIGIADSTENKYRLWRQFYGRQRFLACAEAPEAKQSCCSGKNRKLGKPLNGSLHTGLVIHARKHDEIGSMDRRKRFAQSSGREQHLLLQGTRRINHENIDIPGKLEMLEAIVKKKQIDRCVRLKPA